MNNEISLKIKRITGDNNLGVYVFTKEKLNCSYYINGLNIRTQGIKHCGVYWLYDKDEVVYIGYSENVLGRIKQHAGGGDKKIWDKVKLILFPDKKKAKAIETALLWYFKTRYNSPKYKLHGSLHGKYKELNGLVSIGAYKKLKSDIRLAFHIYAEYCDMDRESFDVATGAIEIIDNINLYRKYANISFEEYDDNFRRRVRGEQHNIELFMI